MSAQLDQEKSLQALRLYSSRYRGLNPPIPDDLKELYGQLETLAQNRDFVSCHSLGCCGFKELAGISNISPERFLEGLCLSVRPGSGEAYMLFTQAADEDGDGDADDGDYGYDFARFLTDNKLGEVKVATEPRKNPNSGNYVTMWAWLPDPGAVKNWFCTRYPVLGPTLYGANQL